MFQDRENLLEKFNELETISDKTKVKKQLDAMTEKIQAWHDQTFDKTKYKKAIDAKETLQDNLSLLTDGKSEKEAYEVLPWVSRSYDC